MAACLVSKCFIINSSSGTALAEYFDYAFINLFYGFLQDVLILKATAQVGTLLKCINFCLHLSTVMEKVWPILITSMTLVVQIFFISDWSTCAHFVFVSNGIVFLYWKNTRSSKILLVRLVQSRCGNMIFVVFIIHTVQPSQHSHI